MALIVEDGTGLNNSEAYCSVQFVNDYLGSIGLGDKWTGTEVQKENYIRRGAEFIEDMFGHSFIGNKKSSTQTLSFPRRLLNQEVRIAYSDSGIPRKLKIANAIAALAALSKTLDYSYITDASVGISGPIGKLTQTVGPYTYITEAATSTVSGADSRTNSQKTKDHIKSLLSEWLGSSPRTIT